MWNGYVSELTPRHRDYSDLSVFCGLHCASPVRIVLVDDREGKDMSRVHTGPDTFSVPSTITTLWGLGALTGSPKPNSKMRTVGFVPGFRRPSFFGAACSDP
uniref:Uncharacterized protein n=1 Tax=Eutreptiella gymnastica TaxID=73025 RepID=A0A7S4G593_9EUGL